MKVDESVENELLSIAEENGGTIPPEAVLFRARDEESPLHPFFTWDDSEAAYQHRLWQARQLIVRVTVRMEERTYEEPIRVQAFVSLPSDRGAGGYRALDAVLSNEEWRAELVTTALKEVRTFRNKAAYRQLEELAPVMEAIDRVLERFGMAETAHLKKVVFG